MNILFHSECVYSLRECYQNDTLKSLNQRVLGNVPGTTHDFSCSYEQGRIYKIKIKNEGEKESLH